MKVKLFVILLGILMMISIVMLRSLIIKKPLPTQPGVFDQKGRHP
jgi:hypothetical protein